MDSDTVTITEVFRKFDINGDGNISRPELANVLKALNPGKWVEESINSILEAADVDGDGQIQYEEFVQWLTASGTDVGFSHSAARNYIKAALEEPERQKTETAKKLLPLVKECSPEHSGKAGAITASLLDEMEPAELACLIDSSPDLRDRVLRQQVAKAASRVEARKAEKKQLREQAEAKRKLERGMLWFAKHGKEEELKRVLEAKCDINAMALLPPSTPDGQPIELPAGAVPPRQSGSVAALHYAAACGHAGNVRLLLSARANVELRMRYARKDVAPPQLGPVKEVGDGVASEQVTGSKSAEASAGGDGAATGDEAGGGGDGAATGDEAGGGEASASNAPRSKGTILRTLVEGDVRYENGDVPLELARRNGRDQCVRLITLWQEQPHSAPDPTLALDLAAPLAASSSLAPRELQAEPTNAQAEGAQDFGQFGPGPMSMSALLASSKPATARASTSPNEPYLKRALRLLQCTGPADVGADAERQLQLLQHEIDRLRNIVVKAKNPMQERELLQAPV